MIKLYILILSGLTLPCYGQVKPQPVVYEHMGRELCQCAAANPSGTIVHRLESCYSRILKEHYEALRKLGLDTADINDKAQIGQGMLEYFKRDCPDVYAAYMKATASDPKPRDPDSSDFHFTGDFVSQKLVANEKDDRLVLRGADGQLKVFCTYLKANIHSYALDHVVTVNYNMVGKTGKKKIVVVSVSLQENIPPEYQQRWLDELHAKKHSN